MKYQVWKPHSQRWIVIDQNGALYDVQMSRIQLEQYLVFGHGISDGTYQHMVAVAQKFESELDRIYNESSAEDAENWDGGPETLEITLD